jgi:branched-subunit amino acid aminotransferase/4-amino-4-deoxychorismate lyase
LGKSKPELVEPSPGYKPLDYAARMAARNELSRRGVKEGLVVSPDGNVIGGLVTNFFVSMDGEKWSTPALSSGCLPGVARHLLLNEVEGIAIAAGTVRRDELKEAASAFVANSILGVQPVHRLFLGNRSWKTLAPGPAQSVREAYLLAFA